MGGWGRETAVGEMGVAAGREGGMLSPSLVSCGYCVPRHCGTATAGHMLRCVCVCVWWGAVNLTQPLPFGCPQLTPATLPDPSVMVGQGSEYCLLKRPLQLRSSSWSQVCLSCGHPGEARVMSLTSWTMKVSHTKMWLLTTHSLLAGSFS